MNKGIWLPASVLFLVFVISGCGNNKEAFQHDENAPRTEVKIVKSSDGSTKYESLDVGDGYLYFFNDSSKVAYFAPTDSNYTIVGATLSEIAKPIFEGKNFTDVCHSLLDKYKATKPINANDDNKELFSKNIGKLELSSRPDPNTKAALSAINQKLGSNLVNEFEPIGAILDFQAGPNSMTALSYYADSSISASAPLEALDLFFGGDRPLPIGVFCDLELRTIASTMTYYPPNGTIGIRNQVHILDRNAQLANPSPTPNTGGLSSLGETYE